MSENQIDPLHHNPNPEHELSHDEPIALDLMQSIRQSVESQLGDFEGVEVTYDLREDLASIPNKLEFKIGEVADLVGVKSYVLRYWETEFDGLHPRKSKHNQRVYTRKDVELIFMIKQLLYRDRFSIEGAKSALRRLKGEVKKEESKQKEERQIATQMDRLRGRADDLLRSIRRLRQQIHQN